MKRVRTESERAANRRSLLFLGKFLALLVAFYVIVASRPVNDAVVVPFTSGIASVSGVVLRAIGEDVRVDGTRLSSPGFAVGIENGCNGVETALLFGSAVLAFPAPWKRRLAGLLLGFLAIQAVNLVRVVSLYWIGVHRPSLFQASHGVLWQSVVVLCGVLLFLLWASRERKRQAAVETAAP
jgi:exosortase H (IPTLxxWG-CTERM-specific)